MHWVDHRQMRIHCSQRNVRCPASDVPIVLRNVRWLAVRRSSRCMLLTGPDLQPEQNC